MRDPWPLAERLPPSAHDPVSVVLRRTGAGVYISGALVGMVVSPLRTTLVEAPVAAGLLLCVFLSAYRSLTDVWPGRQEIRRTALLGLGMPLYFAGARALGTVGAAMTLTLMVVVILLTLRWLAEGEAREAQAYEERRRNPRPRD